MFPDFVIEENIHHEEESNYRYLLKIPFSREPQKSVLVILKNLSTASVTESDVTADRVMPD